MRMPMAAFALAILVNAVGVGNAAACSKPRFPIELQGTWDLYPHPCVAGEVSDSDTRVVIDDSARNNYEDRDTLVAIRQVSDTPRAWRVVATSDLDPGDKLGQALIYVLKGASMIVTDGGRSERYIRCT